MLQSGQRSHSSTDRTGVSEISDVGSIPAEGTSMKAKTKQPTSMQTEEFLKREPNLSQIAKVFPVDNSEKTDDETAYDL